MLRHTAAPHRRPALTWRPRSTHRPTSIAYDGRAATRDGGFATAEAALALPALLVVLALCIGVVVCVSAQLRCVDAARVAARVVARGDSPREAVAAAKAVAPPGARVTVTRTGDQVRVEVHVAVRPFGGAIRLPPVDVSAHAAAEAEDAAR